MKKTSLGFYNPPKIVVDWHVAQEERKATWFEVRELALLCTSMPHTNTLAHTCTPTAVL